MDHCKNCGEMIAPDKPRSNQVRLYCSRACKDASQVKYSEEARRFVETNIGEMSLKTLARKINVTYEGLRKQISIWRNEGYNIGGGKYRHYSK